MESSVVIWPGKIRGVGTGKEAEGETVQAIRGLKKRGGWGGGLRVFGSTYKQYFKSGPRGTEEGTPLLLSAFAA